MSITSSAPERSATSPVGAAAPASKGLLFWGATIVALAMIPIFMLQAFWAHVLITPWYLPIGGTIAALAVIYAMGARRSWWRVIVALLVVALAGLEWFVLLGPTVLPAYHGPIAQGGQIPAFRAALADGTEINASSFAQGRPTAIVFFQGRWCPFCMTQLTELEAHHADFESAKADVVVVSIEDLETASQTQKDFPHLKVVSDEQRELSNAIDVVNKAVAPDGGDADAPTIVLLDGAGVVQWVHRPTRVLVRTSAAELVAKINEQKPR